MRSIAKPKNKKPLIIALIVAAILLLAGVGVYFWMKHKNDTQSPANTPLRPVNSIDYGPPTKQDQQNVDQHKQDIVNQQQNQNQQPSSSISVIINRASQAGAGQPLNIRTTVTGATSGTCSATLTSGGQTASGSGTIALSATTYVCSIDIPASSFANAGQWQLSVTATSNNSTSKLATQNVTITK